MAKFSQKSIEKILTCHHDLQKIALRLIEVFDCVVLEGHRDQPAQDEAFHKGFSKTPWPQSKHNSIPSMAMDLAPYPINWSDRTSFVYMAGITMGLARELNIKLRWGGDWNNDKILSNDKFVDAVHFELI